MLDGVVVEVVLVVAARGRADPWPAFWLRFAPLASPATRKATRRSERIFVFRVAHCFFFL